jgi:hypothetical protein
MTQPSGAGAPAAAAPRPVSHCLRPKVGRLIGGSTDAQGRTSSTGGTEWFPLRGRPPLRTSSANPRTSSEPSNRAMVVPSFACSPCPPHRPSRPGLIPPPSQVQAMHLGRRNKLPRRCSGLHAEGPSFAVRVHRDEAALLE